MGEPVNDDMEEMRRKQEEAEKKIGELLAVAGKTLATKMKEDEELRRLGYMMLLSSRLFTWSISEASSIKGMSNEMVQILMKSQQEKAREVFDFAALIGDLQDKQMPWLESKRREALARQRSREKRIKAMMAQVRRKDIELPVHSMSALFDSNFTHQDTLVVMGEKRAVIPILQLCARKYTKSGGHVALLSSNEVVLPSSHLAKHILPPQIWRNAASIYGDLKVLLEPLSKGLQPLGLTVIEDLDNLLLQSPIPANRMTYLRRSYALLEQYQMDHGGATIIGIHTDADPLGLDRIQLYPPELLAKHVAVVWQEPKVSDIPSILVGNDILLMSEIEKELREPE